MSEPATKVIDHEMTEMAAQAPLKKGELLGPDGIRNLQEKRGRSEIAVGHTRGGVRFTSAQQMIDMATMMAASDTAVPKHLRGNPGACLRVVMQADEWGFGPFAVADKSYFVNDRIAYESQLIHSVIERHAPLRERLTFSYENEGTPEMVCIVSGHFLGEKEPRVWRSQKIKDIKPQNSPEWKNNPPKQLFYHTSRDWARIFCPDVLLGVYSRDEIGEDFRNDRIREIEGGQTLADRLPAEQPDRPGFDSDGIATQLRSTIGAPAEAAGKPAEPAQQSGAEAEPSHEPPPEPTNETEYVAWAERWFAKMPNREDAMARWDGERELRAACKMSIKKRKELEKALEAKFPVPS